MRPAGPVLRVQIPVGLGDRRGVHDQFRMLRSHWQRPRAGRIDETIDDDIRHVDTVNRILLGQHLREPPVALDDAEHRGKPQAGALCSAGRFIAYPVKFRKDL